MTANAGAPRRQSHQPMPVAYAAIGAAAAPDLLRFPPAGSTPYEESLQLGSGQERFLTAQNLLLSWGAQRVAGVQVSDIVSGKESAYNGVRFDDAGTPALASESEEMFTDEGVAHLRAGTTATFTAASGQPRQVLVVATIYEHKRAGFIWGDRNPIAAHGEQQLSVELRDDGTVWAVARGFAFLSESGLLASLQRRSELKEVIQLARAYLAALLPGAATLGKTT